MYVHSSEDDAPLSPDHLRPLPARAAGPRRLIKRYANRKLYDTRTSAYVNLSDIAEMVRDGEDVEVREAETQRDLTGMVLAHVVSAEERRGARGGGRVLADLIRDPGAPRRPVVVALAPGAEGSRAPDGDRGPAAPVAVPAAPFDDRTDRLLNEGHRLTACLRAMTAASREAVARLQGQSNARADASHDVVAALARLKRELTRIARTIDLLHDRLHHLEG